MVIKFEKWLVVIATLLTIGVNGLANSLPINNQTTGEISDRFDVLFVPAGYVFSIWGLIYLGLIAFSIYQVLPAQTTHPRVQRVRWPYLAASLSNISWLLCWHYNLFGLSMLAMMALLTNLIVIYLRLDIGRIQVSNSEKGLGHIPFSIYLGWITVATIANATVVLTFYEWNAWGMSPEVWTAILLIVGVILAYRIQIAHGDIAYTLVLTWAYSGIAVKLAGSSFAQVVWITVACLVVASGVGWFFYQKDMKRKLEA
jgi:hypothetical protein